MGVVGGMCQDGGEGEGCVVGEVWGRTIKGKVRYSIVFF